MSARALLAILGFYSREVCAKPDLYFKRITPAAVWRKRAKGCAEDRALGCHPLASHVTSRRGAGVVGRTEFSKGLRTDG